MSSLDTRTAFMIVGLLYLLLPAVTWVVLEGQRTLQVVLWCGGGLLVGITWILVSLRGTVPDWISVSLVTLIFLASHFARIQSLRLDLGKPWRKHWILLAILTIFLVFQYLHYGLRNYVLRAQFNSFVTVGFLFYLATLAWHIGCQEQSSSAKWIARVYGLVVAAGLFRIYVLMRSSGNPDLLREGLSAQLFTLSILLSSIVGHLGYVGLALDRSKRRELIAAMEHARAEESHRLGAQIAHLDRQRSLGEMAASLGHELNQPLTAVLTNAQVAKLGLHSGHADTIQLSEFLDKIVYNTKRASQIIERIRDFIRPSASRSEPVDLNRIVLEVAELIAGDARSQQVKIQFHPGKQTVQVLGDSIQLSCEKTGSVLM